MVKETITYLNQSVESVGVAFVKGVNVGIEFFEKKIKKQ